VGVASLLVGAVGRAADDPVASAVQASQKTGLPILAVAGSKTCGFCVALKDRLQSDQSLQPLLAQFVPLEIDVTTSVWQTWAQKFPPEANAIPIIYVIRADGEVLYSKSGAPQGDALPQLLGGLRGQAGEALTAKQAEKLAQALAAAKAALEAGDVGKAVALMAPSAKIESYAQPAIEARALVDKLTEEAKAAVEEAAGQLDSEDDALVGAVALARLARVYKKLPAILKQVVTVKKEHNDPALKPLFTQAGLIDKAVAYVEQGQKEKAIRAFQAVATKYPDTPAATLALARVDELSGAEPPAVGEGDAADATRPASGKLTTGAR
jgi:hypothetical protein